MDSEMVEDGKLLDMVERDLRPYAHKPVGSLRIDMREVRAILRVIERARAAIAAMQQGEPVAWMVEGPGREHHLMFAKLSAERIAEEIGGRVIALRESPK
ncbi:hypothetical protein [Novosphingobium sp. M1R2S20]|uniref:Uncharacterized protein n=1 Tax=Novosphingobium rhizovicinum TaxID=3228928 RepID=A0ABV3RE33_9SPHN